MARSFTARWLVPVEGPPLRDGILTIDDGRIVAIEPPGTRDAIDLGNVAVLPGFVNAHTHLDLSGDRIPFEGSFTDWLRAVIGSRITRTPEQVGDAVASGLSASIRSGATLLADISSGGASWPILRDAAIRSVVFYELLGLSTERAEAALSKCEEWLDAAEPTPMCRAGLSPHAPYSVRTSLFEWAATRGWPVAVHLAETRDELALLESKSGPFVGFLEALGVWDADGLACDAAHVVELCGKAPRLLLAHGNYLSEDEPIPEHATVVYCPRTHDTFGHPTHPLGALIGRGVRVALGTDSLASNPDLDILAEARFVRSRYPSIPGETLAKMLTLWGTESLGLGSETGSLTVGKSADFVAVHLGEGDNADPYESVFSGVGSVERVFCRGTEVHCSDSSSGVRS